MSENHQGRRLDLKSLDLGLLKFCLEHGKVDSSTASSIPTRDQNDYKWLREAFDSLEDDVKRMVRCISALSSDDEEELLKALEELQFLLEELFNACDIHKLNGIVPVRNLLNHRSSLVRDRAAWVVSTTAHNNPIGRDACLHHEVLPALLQMITTETNDQALSRGLSAISALIQHNPVGLEVFLSLGGLAGIVSWLQHSSSRVKLRAILLLRHCMSEDCSLDAALVNECLGIVQSVAFSDEEDIDTQEMALCILELSLCNSMGTLGTDFVDKALIRRLNKLKGEEYDRQSRRLELAVGILTASPTENK